VRAIVRAAWQRGRSDGVGSRCCIQRRGVHTEADTKAVDDACNVADCVAHAAEHGGARAKKVQARTEEELSPSAKRLAYVQDDHRRDGRAQNFGRRESRCFERRQNIADHVIEARYRAAHRADRITVQEASERWTQEEGQDAAASPKARVRRCDE
jgi:hypothetical protein